LSNEKVWQAVLGEMEVVLPKAQFATWFKDTSLEVDGDGAVVFVSNSFGRDWIASKYKNELMTAICKTCPEVNKLDIKLKQTRPMERLPLEVRAMAKQERPSPKTPSLKKDYTFDNFVVGNNNSFAYAVAKEVASAPGTRHNPLFIYGGVGLGKTHLAQAIGHEVLTDNPEARIVYVSCETFTNDFISAIASKKMAQFKKNYRDVDVLIVDDIQFLSSKEGSQEEFFHTFNALQQKSRQIILTADKIPQAIPALEGRLASRFGGGMVVDVQPPNYETRMAILREKCKEKNYFLNEEVIEYIARNIRSNIRELEGALNRLATACQFKDSAPTVRLAQEILKDNISSSNHAADSAEIISSVSKYYGIAKEDILGKNRKKELILPRQISIYLIREMTNKSLPEIGKIMGGKDHTTIMHSQKRIEGFLKTDITIKSDIEKIREDLASMSY
jgi:chromosomal replication initiator protein